MPASRPGRSWLWSFAREQHVRTRSPGAGGGSAGVVGGGGSGIAAPGIRAGGGGGGGAGGVSPGNPVYADTAGGNSGGDGLRALPAGCQPWLGVDDVVRVKHRGQERVDRNREVVEVEVQQRVEHPQRRAQIQAAQLARLVRGGVLEGPDCVSTGPTPDW